ncbi:MAG: permease, partial [Burkholderiales bacterium]
NWTALRLVLGLLMVFGLGYLVNRLVTPQEAQAAEAQLARITENTEPGNAFARWLKTLSRMTLHLVPEYIVLVLLLGAARAFLFPHIGPEIGNHLGWIAAFAVAGALFVIPTAGEVPIIQAMLALGMGVGPAGALLMTLPPISVPSLAMLVPSFSPRLLAVVAMSVVAFGVAGGLLAIWLNF